MQRVDCVGPYGYRVSLAQGQGLNTLPPCFLPQLHNHTWPVQVW